MTRGLTVRLVPPERAEPTESELEGRSIDRSQVSGPDGSSWNLGKGHTIRSGRSPGVFPLFRLLTGTT